MFQFNRGIKRTRTLPVSERRTFRVEKSFQALEKASAALDTDTMGFEKKSLCYVFGVLALIAVCLSQPIIPGSYYYQGKIQPCNKNNHSVFTETQSCRQRLNISNQSYDH